MTALGPSPGTTLDPGLYLFRTDTFSNLRAEVRLNSPVPRYAQIYAALHEMIIDGTLRGGTWMPTERQMARFLLVAPSTVQPATRRLVAEGHLARVDGRGFVVKPPST